MLPGGIPSWRVDWAANPPIVSGLKLLAGSVTHGGDIRGYGCLRVPFVQHVEYSAPSFGIDAGVRVSTDGISNGGQQIVGCVHSVSRTQCISELLQANLPYFRKPGVVPVSWGIVWNEKIRTIP